MFRRKKDERPAAPAAERGPDRPASLDRPPERAASPSDRPAGAGPVGGNLAPDRPPPPFVPPAENVELPRMIASRPPTPAVPSLQSPPSQLTPHQPSAPTPPAAAAPGLQPPPQPPSMPSAPPPKTMVPFVAPAQPGFAVRPPQAPAAPQPPREARSEPRPAPSDGGKRLLVGRDIYLSGQITSCDRLLVEGRVEATLSDSSTIEIAESGIFKGRAEIDDAEIAGRFEGDITVRGRLFIRATGRLRGKIRYGQIEIEPGGEIAGEVEVMSKAHQDLAEMGDRPSANGHDDGDDILGRSFAESEAKLV